MSILAPISAPVNVPIVSGAAIAGFSFPAAVYTAAPVAAVMPTMSLLVAAAVFTSRPRMSTSIGALITPPPIPAVADISPAVRLASHAVIHDVFVPSGGFLFSSAFTVL